MIANPFICTFMFKHIKTNRTKSSSILINAIYNKAMPLTEKSLRLRILIMNINTLL